MLCPKCQTDNLHLSSIGLQVCLKCGYIVQPEDSTNSTGQDQNSSQQVSSDPYVHNNLSDYVNIHEDAIYQSFEEPAGQSLIGQIFSNFGMFGSGLTTNTRRYIFGFAAVFAVAMIILFSILGVQNSQGTKLLGQAKEQSQSFEYDNAHSTLEKARKKWTFSSTKKAITSEMANVERWQQYKQDQTKGEDLIKSQDYTSAIAILEPITEDYPQYPEVQKDLELAYSKLGDSGNSVADVYVETPTNTNTPVVDVGTPNNYRQPVVVRSGGGGGGGGTTGGTTSPTPTPTTTPRPTPTPTPVPIYPITNSLCNVDYHLASDLGNIANNVASVCLIAFPLIEQKLSASPYGPLHQIIFDNATSVSGNTVKLNSSWMRNHTTDMAIVVHNLTHVVTSYPAATPTWLNEGMADYVSFELGYANTWSYYHCDSASRYNSGNSNCTATFLKYLEKKYSAFGISVSKELHNRLKNGTYSEAEFTSMTGRTLEQEYATCRITDCSGGKL